MLLLIDNYDSFTYNLYQYIAELSDAEIVVVRNNQITIDLVKKQKPSHIILSPGPKTPKDAGICVPLIQSLYKEIPIFGICLGHQLLGLTFGCEVEKLKFGHHAINHPVSYKYAKEQNIPTVEITSQNHNYAIKEVTEELEVTHTHLNDETISGMRHKSLPIYSVQYHPESNPGPHDSHYLFKQFIAQLAVNNNK